MKIELTDDVLLRSLPHPDDERILEAAREALLEGMSNVFIVGEEEFHVDACFLALYQQLKLQPGLHLHRMMSPKVDDIVELFNTVLADLSIEEARNQQAQERHIIVMPDFGPNAGKEWLACESLVNTFPGANVGMLAFSTESNHDAAALQQLSLKSRNNLIRLTEMDHPAIKRYFSECHQRGALADLLPSLQQSPWYGLAMEILGLDVSDALKQSVSDYDESKSISPHTDYAGGQAAEQLGGAFAEATDQKAPSRWINWRALLPRIGSLIAVGIIILSASAVILAVAGALHPPVWELTQSLVKPWIEEIMDSLEPLFQRLPH